MQNITDESVEKFLSGRCTPEEAAMIWEYLKNNPDEKYLLNEYERTDGKTALPPGLKEEMLAFIEAAIAEEENKPVLSAVNQDTNEEQASVRRRSIVPAWGWAAAAILLLALGIWYGTRPGKKTIIAEFAGQQPAPISWITQSNNGKQAMTLLLPDHSTVILQPGAHLKYRKDFGQYARREIYMEGKARFKVAKNPEKPFTVHSENIATTALGTVFDVIANKNSSTIMVKLYRGKVLVALEEQPAKGKDYYLMPGQEFVFERNTHQVAINEFGKREEEELHIAKPAHVASPDSMANWYMFNNQSLADVFDQLSVIYNVKIEYPRKEIRKIYFIGKLEKKDSLSDILEDIALLNHLSVANRDGGYIIQVRKP